jgi:Leucine-rich repeat (LRR) protein
MKCTSLSKVHPSIGFLRRLKWVNLRDCKSLERLVDKMRSKSLEYLDLSGCSRLNKLPDFVGNMTSLWYLDLNGTAIKELPFSSKTLCSLNISNCSRLEKIPKDLISVMERPWKICVAGSGSDLISILMPNSFSSLSSLIYLDFSNCNLSDGAIPNDLCCLSSLEYLNLSGNKFTRIPDIWQLSKLEKLDLSHCNLLDGTIPNDLCCLSTLGHLNLSGNKFTRIPDIWQLSKLEKLDLSHCNLLDGAIPNDLCCLSTLGYLNLSGNKFTRIPDIWQLSKLEKLDLSYCNLLDVAIPNDLSGISSLWCLNLSGNNFTRLPDTLAQLSRLEQLYLEDCSRLQVLPRLPFELENLSIKACPLLKMFYEQMDVWTSNEILRSTDCSFAAADIDYDGKPSKILYLDPRSPIWIESNHNVSLLLISFLTHKIKL